MWFTVLAVLLHYTERGELWPMKELRKTQTLSRRPNGPQELREDRLVMTANLTLFTWLVQLHITLNGLLRRPLGGTITLTYGPPVAPSRWNYYTNLPPLAQSWKNYYTNDSSPLAPSPMNYYTNLPPLASPRRKYCSNLPRVAPSLPPVVPFRKIDKRSQQNREWFQDVL